MAMYYQSSSEIQADGLHTLYLMNPNYNIGYYDTQPQSNMLVPHAPPQQDHHYSMWGSNNLQTPPRGLSLSLAAHHQQTKPDHEFPADNSSPPSHGGVSSAIMGSKYLKAAQALLDEVVNVGNHRTDKAKPIKNPAAAAAPSANKDGAAVSDLTTAQRQEIQMKKAKLHSMLDEVEQRCRQYEQQMQMIVAAFEQAAGTGSARSYTQLALKTILKQFRCLKSTICAQMKALNKSLGEEQGSELPRLRFVDRQQVGMLHNNAWRPQRGLPERAVSVLRAWLFQHFLHPYPKNSDKQMLAKQTGLTRSQVSNWFINARVRLWKPMVEEMYLQETSIKAEPTILSDHHHPLTAADNSLSLALPPAHPFLSHRTFEAYQLIDFHNRKPFPPPDLVASTPASGFIN
ncbi:BEL1-like homeodomain protein 1 [Salvia miltiorrhiza]|uniref:BEL1-like homeodomain protein 1 n=1 Tax=Salvia miltiorrhiza TaxID=226208 RepID=UPI0025AD0995|nr:BEL1-like homeodomain protein 1 [Salvia miltiorrhiza]